ncbi:MAG TPA: hypothetical protein VM715_22645, partial [Candidatus Acidoferrum sp.]|nr:hypothetical protein [Candidatus Acidoferrum sp.]
VVVRHLFLQPRVDSMRGVALLARRLPIRDQNLIDELLGWSDRRTRPPVRVNVLETPRSIIY